MTINRSWSARIPFLACTFLALSASSALSQVEPLGFSVTTKALAVSGGLDVLPSGDLVLFDGTSVVRVDLVTCQQTVLYTPGLPVFGSFVRHDRTRRALWFGESTAGTITLIPLRGGMARTVATIAFNFDLALDRLGRVFVCADPNFTGNTIFHVDPTTGQTDEIARFQGPSGPIAFDRSGNLHYVTQDANFPPPPGSSDVLAFSPEQIRSALGPAVLNEMQARVFARGLDGGFRARFSTDGALYVAHGSQVDRVDRSGVQEIFTRTRAGQFASYLAFAPGPRPFFLPYAPSGGTLHLSTTDFSSTNELLSFETRRPALNVQPANPVPPGTIEFAVTAGPPLGAFVPLFAFRASAREQLFAFDSPIYLALPPQAVLVLEPLALDGQGRGTLRLSTGTTPLGGVTAFSQALCLELQSAPRIVGSTNAVRVFVQ